MLLRFHLYVHILEMHRVKEYFSYHKRGFSHRHHQEEGEAQQSTASKEKDVAHEAVLVPERDPIITVVETGPCSPEIYPLEGRLCFDRQDSTPSSLLVDTSHSPPAADHVSPFSCSSSPNKSNHEARSIS